ncbi:hypothetical protein FDECE_13173 [Fusarium decemcellulare]|nr:hypothetical protein FDECE_13173 [Fusarium decemcellulare]
MEPLAIVAASFSLAGAIAKASIALTAFSRDISASADDLNRISTELQALSTILDPITRALSRDHQNALPSQLIQEVDNTLNGCLSVVRQVEDKVHKYQEDKAWTKTKWVLFGQGDMQKLRESLEFYKVALGLGLHAVSVHTGQDIKEETNAIRTNVEAVMLRTDEILARVNSIRKRDPASKTAKNVQQWVDDIALLSSYAESSYMETVVDPAENRDIGPSTKQGDKAHKASRDTHQAQAQPSNPSADKDPSVPKEGHKEKIAGIKHPETWPTGARRKKSSIGTIAHSPGEDEKPAALGDSDSRDSVGSHPSTLLTRSRTMEITVAAKTNGAEKGSPREENRAFSPLSAPRRHSTPRPNQRPPSASIPIAERNIVLGDSGTECTGFIADKVKAISSIAHPDKNLMQHSQARRQQLEPLQAELLDQELCNINQSTAARAIRATIAKGGDPNRATTAHEISVPLKAALALRNTECLCALLQGGIDPNARVSAFFSALPYAAYQGYEEGVWALVSAGADTNSLNTIIRKDNTERAHENCPTPLLGALHPKFLMSSAQPLRQSQLEKQVRIVRFLLERGADPSFCGSKAYIHNFTHKPISKAIQKWTGFNDSTAYHMARLLLEAGATVDLSSIPIQSDKISDDNPFHIVAHSGNEKLLTLLGIHVVPKCHPKHWQRAISCAARSEAWGCVRILTEPPYARKDSLLYLIDDYMSPTALPSNFDKLTWSNFSQAAEMLLASGVDPAKKELFSYEKRRFLTKNGPASQRISPLKLVNKIATHTKRSEVRDLLL